MKNEGSVSSVSASVRAEAEGQVREPEQFAARSEWEKSFWLGVNSYLESGYVVDEPELHRRCQTVFDKAWARGGGRFLADRHGYEIWSVANWAAKSAQGVDKRIRDDGYKAALAKLPAAERDAIEREQKATRAIRAKYRRVAIKARKAADAARDAVWAAAREVRLVPATPQPFDPSPACSDTIEQVRIWIAAIKARAAAPTAMRAAGEGI